MSSVGAPSHNRCARLLGLPLNFHAQTTERSWTTDHSYPALLTCRRLVRPDVGPSSGESSWVIDVEHC